MRDNWREWIRHLGWEAEGDAFWVQVGSRRQRLTIVEDSGVTLLRSRVGRPGIVNRVTDPELRAWQRNRVSELVGFRIDPKGNMVAETPVPAGAGRQEWSFLAFNLARSADRFEHILSGRDDE